MGIPHLITNLQPHAPLVVLEGHVRNTRNQSDSVIIDGPGLAYHVYYRCLARRKNARNPFEAGLDYAELGSAAVDWLSELTRRKLNVSKIYFDGYLPPAKRPTRTKRLQSHLNQLNKYRPLTINGFGMAALGCQKRDSPSINTTSSTKDNELFNSLPVPSRLTSLPAPPFLVPAVIEALSTSAYRSITEVVPGEADTFCAEYAKEHGGMIITGDSDLLVHDLGLYGSVILFRDIGFSELDGSKDEPSLVGFEYRPMEIAKKLGLKDLLGLAFCMTQGGSGGFSNCLQKVKSGVIGTEADPEFREFCQEYLFSPHSLALLRSEKETLLRRDLQTRLRRTDPRISEFIHKFAFPSNAGDSVEVEVFLPFLVDDPSRASAWKVGLFLRQMAYSITNIFLSPGEVECASVQEWSRRGGEVYPINTALFSLEGLLTACDSFVSLLKQIGSRLPEMTATNIWKVYGAYEVCRWHNQEGKACPSALELKQVLTGCLQSTTLNWSLVHLFAQLHAAMYSVRMLQRALEVSSNFATRLERFSNSSTLDVLSTLSTQLSTLPSIDGFFSFQFRLANQAQEEQSKDEWDNAFSLVFELLDDEEQEIDVTGQQESTQASRTARLERRSKKRQKRKGKSSKQVGKSGTTSKNPYAHLAEG